MIVPRGTSSTKVCFFVSPRSTTQRAKHRAVSSLLGLRAVRVEDAIAKVRLRTLGRLNGKQLVEANTSMPIREHSNLRRSQLGALG